MLFFSVDKTSYAILDLRLSLIYPRDKIVLEIFRAVCNLNMLTNTSLSFSF